VSLLTSQLASCFSNSKVSDDTGASLPARQMILLSRSEDEGCALSHVVEADGKALQPATVAACRMRSGRWLAGCLTEHAFRNQVPPLEWNVYVCSDYTKEQRSKDLWGLAWSPRRSSEQPSWCGWGGRLIGGSGRSLLGTRLPEERLASQERRK
jgi:hypothetical protein